MLCAGLPAGAQFPKQALLRGEEKGGRFLLQIDTALLGRDLFIGTRVRQISQLKNIAAGQTFFQPEVFRFERQGNLLLMKSVNTEIQLPEGDPAGEMVMNNNASSIWKTIPVAESAASLSIDLSKWLAEEVPDICPLPSGFKTGKFEAALSGVTGVQNLPDRVNITAEYHYSGKRSFYVKINYTLMVAPEPMKPRIWDERVGCANIQKYVYNLGGQIEKVKYANRWRIEPAPEDWKKYLRGEKVVPEKPIVMYIDKRVPELIYKNVKAGILDWNKAFEAIGFKDAIQVKELPLTTPAGEPFNSEDLLVSAFRYVPTENANAMGATLTDSRTGEIIQGDIVWYHNVLKLLQEWRFVQTAAADPAARGEKLGDAVMGELIRYAAAHEMGHVLGFQHNLRSSFAYPVDSLRSPSFTARYGTTASIMDYARNNFVARKGDAARGVSMLPPRLGPYDYLSVAWLYKPYYQLSAEEEKKKSDEFLLKSTFKEEHRFARMTSDRIPSDPAGQPDMLSNDPIRATALAVENFREIIENLAEWTTSAGGSCDYMEQMYESVIKHFFKYLNCCASYVGGVYYYPAGTGGVKERYVPVSPQQSAAAVRFLIQELIRLQQWGETKQIKELLGGKYLSLLNKQKEFLDQLLVKGMMDRILSADSGYTVADYLNQLAEALYPDKNPADRVGTIDWMTPAGGNALRAQRELWQAFLKRLDAVTKGEGKEEPGAEVLSAVREVLQGYSRK